MISSLIPSILFLLFALLEPPDLALPLDEVDDEEEDCELVVDVFDELGDDVDALLLFVLPELAALLALLLLLLLLFELPLEDPPPADDDPPDCFSFLSLIIFRDTFFLIFTQFLMCNTFSLSVSHLKLFSINNFNFSLLLFRGSVARTRKLTLSRSHARG